MKIKINVICRKDRINKNNEAPISLRFTSNRKSKYVSTGLTVKVDDWDFEKQRIKPNINDEDEIQYQIDTKLFEYEKKIRKLEALDIEVTLDTLLDANKRSRNDCKLFECFEREITRLESLGKMTSASKHKVTISLLSQFRTASTRFEDIDLAYLNDFELYLRKRGNKDNSIATKFSVFKAIYNRAISEELFTPKSNPFVKYKVGKLWTPTRKRAISKEELQKLIDLHLPEKTSTHYLEFAKDIFLFTYFTAGINIGDIADLRHSDIRNGRVNYTRNKTGKEINCKLMPIAVEIINKYSSPFYADDDYIFPILDRYKHITPMQRYNRIHKVTQKVNKQLKELGKLVNISTPLTTYVARHIQNCYCLLVI